MSLYNITNMLSLSTKKIITQNTKLSYVLCSTINDGYVIIFNDDEFIKVQFNDDNNIQKKYINQNKIDFQYYFYNNKLS